MSALPPLIDPRDVLARLRQAHDRFELESNRCRAVARSWQMTSFPPWGRFQIDVGHQAIGQGCGDVFDAVEMTDGRRLVYLADAGGLATPSAALTGFVIRKAIADAIGQPGLTAGGLLKAVNSTLLAWQSNPVAMTVLIFADSSSVEVARAGLPAPWRIASDGSVDRWSTPGPLLGLIDADYPTDRFEASEGSRVILSTVPSLQPHSKSTAEQLLSSLMPDVRPDDDRTILVISR
jgi:serine phosphatase RsbU (regulator of sigma subunit)